MYRLHPTYVLLEPMIAIACTLLGLSRKIFRHFHLNIDTVLHGLLMWLGLASQEDGLRLFLRHPWTLGALCLWQLPNIIRACIEGLTIWWRNEDDVADWGFAIIFTGRVVRALIHSNLPSVTFMQDATRDAYPIARDMWCLNVHIEAEEDIVNAVVAAIDDLRPAGMPDGNAISLVLGSS